MRIRIKDECPIVTDHQFMEINVTNVKEGLWEAILPNYGLYKLNCLDKEDLFIEYSESKLTITNKKGKPVDESIAYPY